MHGAFGIGLARRELTAADVEAIRILRRGLKSKKGGAPMRFLIDVRILTTIVWSLAVSFSHGAAMAAEEELVVRPEAHPLVLTGLVESNPIQVEGVLWATLQGWTDTSQPKLSVRLVDESLRKVDTDGGQSLGITDVSFDPSEPELVNGRATAIKVTVKNVEWPGLYRGKLEYVLEVGDSASASAKKSAEKLKGDRSLELDIRTKPRISSPETEIDVGLVRCWSIGCDVAGWFLAENPEPGPLAVELRNDSLRSVIIESHAHLRKETTEEIVTALELPARREVEIAAAPERFDFALKAAEIQPGSYQGNLLFVARPQLEKVLKDRGPQGAALVRNRTDLEIPVKVYVRAGIGIPLLLVFIGIIAGRLNREISTPEAQERLKLYDMTVALGDRIDPLKDRNAKPELRSQLAAIRRQIEDVDVPAEDIRKALDELTERVRILEDLEASENELQRQLQLGADAAAAAAIQSEIDSARLAAPGQDVTAEKERLTRIRAAVLELAAGAAQPRVSAALAAPAGTVRAATTRTATRRQRTVESVKKSVVKALAVLAGLRRLSVRTSYWYFQPLATLLLLGALTVYGVFLFYTGDENRTFGVNGLVDYFPLFLWGFGSDVLTKRLQDIRFTRS